MRSVIALVVCICALAASAEQKSEKVRNFITYRVNPGEGLNLRKDVLLRMAANVRELKDKWTLALPPLRTVPHWNDAPHLVPVETGVRQDDIALAREKGTIKYLSWSDLIDVRFLRQYVRTIDYPRFLEINGPEISTVVHVISRKEIDFSKELTAWVSDCSQWNARNSSYDIPDFGKPNAMWHDCPLFGKEQECVVGPASFTKMRDIIEDHFAPKAAQANEVGKSYSLLLSRIETMMWDRMWGTDGYWEARRHFTFAQELHDRANMFMKLAGLGNGKFLAIHMRRGDFLYSRKDQIPSLADVAEQLQPVLKKRGLSAVFVASDASERELEELRVAFGVNVRVLGYKFTQSFVGSDYPYHVADAQIGIIDQIVCSHAEVFYGTMHSYFSITIYEERVLWGKDNDSTYNVICPRHPKPHDRRKDAKPDEEFACEPPTRWLPPNRVMHAQLLKKAKEDGKKKKEHSEL